MKKRNLMVVLVFTLFVSCQPKEKYKALSFFFDGVPNPDAEIHVQEDGLFERSAIQDPGGFIVSYHESWANKECEKCHDPDNIGRMLAAGNPLCFTCHEESNYQGLFIHEPVVSQECTACHYPHKSQFPNLLIAKDRFLCLKCHIEEDVDQIQDHGTFDDCSSCHTPHISDNPMLLKGGVYGKSSIKAIEPR